jgi:HK97 family phage prohead protease
MKTQIEFKIGGSIKDVDTEKRIVTGYFTSTGTLDSDKDIFAKGAFKKTITELGPAGKNRIWHLFQHDIDKPLNKPYHLEETNKGVYFETRIPDTDLGRWVLTLYQEGALSEHSVGFETQASDPDKSGNRLIKEVKMWEGSTVLWGANENTPFAGMKAAERIKQIENILDKTIDKDDLYFVILQEIEKMKAALTRPLPQEPAPKQPELNLRQRVYLHLTH